MAESESRETCGGADLLAEDDRLRNMAQPVILGCFNDAANWRAKDACRSVRAAATGADSFVEMHLRTAVLAASQAAQLDSAWAGFRERVSDLYRRATQ